MVWLHWDTSLHEKRARKKMLSGIPLCTLQKCSSIFFFENNQRLKDRRRKYKGNVKFRCRFSLVKDKKALLRKKNHLKTNFSPMCNLFSFACTQQWTHQGALNPPAPCPYFGRHLLRKNSGLKLVQQKNIPTKHLKSINYKPN